MEEIGELLLKMMTSGKGNCMQRWLLSTQETRILLADLSLKTDYDVCKTLRAKRDSRVLQLIAKAKY